MERRFKKGRADSKPYASCKGHAERQQEAKQFIHVLLFFIKRQLEVLTMKRKPMLWEAISCFVVMVIIIGVGKGLLKLDIQPLLILAAFYAAVIGKRLGYSYQDRKKA